MFKVLIMGLSGSGKSTLAEQLHKKIPDSVRLNADTIRRSYNDWDFSEEGRIRQAKRIKQLSDVCDEEYIIIDVIAPFEIMRSIIDADYVIWMNTIKESNYKDTDDVFKPPYNADLVIKSLDYSVDDIIASINRL
jgi:adenylylsulfate kinase